jgi:GTPase Era involved in 16S rRNA processing
MSKINEDAINMIILGEVSSGKSTLLNSIYVKTFSDMKRIRTTMSANIYADTNKKDEVQNIDQILKTNQATEKELKNGNLLSIKENLYPVTPSTDFGSLLVKKGYQLNVIDYPGLNDGVGNDIMLKWLDDNFHKFDVIVNVIGNAFNTKSEKDIFEMICAKMKKNPRTKLIAVINKHDDDEDEELIEMKEQAEAYIEKTLSEFQISEARYKVCAISAEKGYLYRYVKYNKTLDGLTQKHKSMIAEMELGRKSKKQDDAHLLAELLESIKDTEPTEITRYKVFINAFRSLIVDNVTALYYEKKIQNIMFTTLDDFLCKYAKLIADTKIENVANDTYFITTVNNFIDQIFSQGFSDQKIYDQMIKSLNIYKDLIHMHVNHTKITENIYSKFKTIKFHNDMYCCTIICTKLDLFDPQMISEQYVREYLLSIDYIGKIITNLTLIDDIAHWNTVAKYLFGDIFVMLISIIKKIKINKNNGMLDLYISFLFDVNKRYTGVYLRSIISIFLKSVAFTFPEIESKYPGIVFLTQYAPHNEVWNFYYQYIVTGKELMIDIISPMFKTFYKMSELN